MKKTILVIVGLGLLAASYVSSAACGGNGLCPPSKPGGDVTCCKRPQ